MVMLTSVFQCNMIKLHQINNSNLQAQTKQFGHYGAQNVTVAIENSKMTLNSGHGQSSSDLSIDESSSLY